MPIHDWTRVTAGTWHDFHLAWITEIRNVLNDGLLPPDYYAQAEQIAEPAQQPPQTRIPAEAEMNGYVLRRRSLVVRHASGDRIVALVDLVSPGSKSSRHALRSFVEKAVESLYRGYHLLIVDLFPPGSRNPHGIHAAIWRKFSDDPMPLPAEESLTLVAYSPRPVERAFVEPTAVGQTLADMPLFLEPDVYVNLPLETTYQAAYRGVPRRWRDVLE